MNVQVLRCLNIGHAAILDQPHSLKLELARKLPSLHDPPPAPSKHLTRCLRNRAQATRDVDLVGFDPFFLPTSRLHPERLGLLAGLLVARIPIVVEVLARNVTEEKHVVWLGCERQTEPQNPRGG